MSPHNDLSALPFEEKIKLLDDTEKTCTGELINLLLAERHEKRYLPYQMTNKIPYGILNKSAGL
jgi:hypothetical protein